MLLSASDIAAWAKTRGAQGELPMLIRRLIGQTATLTAISMPARESVSVGGFDGEIHATDGSAWVAKGKSVWELSVEGNPRGKADRDYDKRTLGIPKEVRADTTYVAVTGRKWSKRGEWVREKLSLSEWKDIKAYDADDLELWLEQEAGVQLWFSDLLGISNGSLSSPEQYWNDWNRDVVPSVSFDAVLSGRTLETERLLKLLQERKGGGTIAIHADSSEEAVAFSCATIIRDYERKSLRCAVVKDQSGWHAIAQSNNIQIAIAAETSVASFAPSRNGLVLLVPFATGDSELHFPNQRRLDADPDICLQRTLPESFRESLVDMGIARGDAERLALQCGRSWSVYRRVKNNNPSRKQPTWGDEKYAPVLTTIALIGAYVHHNEADKKIVEFISGISADEFLSQAEKLIRTDDAPIIRISGVIKAKSSLEIFKMNEAGISEKMLARFFEACENVLGQPDPAFDMPRENRWLANVEGKIRPESGALLRSLADALPRISFLCAEDHWRWQISQIVKRLTCRADGRRWLALSDILQQLAEAAPDEFIEALELDLATSAPNIFALFEETTSGGYGACVYAHLLWALEALAWAPNRLLRVSRVLADLAAAPKEGNWSNTPQASLLSIYRGWRPQTAATTDMRNRAITALSKSHPKQTFGLVMGILHRGHDVASPSARPNWRDDDAGNVDTVTNKDYSEALIHAANVGFDLAGDSYEHAIALFERYDIFDPSYRTRALKALTNALESAQIKEARIIRRSLRHKIHAELNYGGTKNENAGEGLSAIQKIYEDSQPDDLVERHHWLFENYYCELPEKDGRQTSSQAQDRLKALRTRALREVYDALGIQGIEALSLAAGPQNCVGYFLQYLDIGRSELIDYVAEKIGATGLPSFLGDWIRSFSPALMNDLLRKAIDKGKNCANWGDAEIYALLEHSRCEPVAWKIVREQPCPIQTRYWQSIFSLPLGLPLRVKKYGIKKLLTYNNHSAALRSLKHGEEGFSGNDIADILERNFSSPTNALKEIDFHDIRSLTEAMEKCDKISRQRLLTLEFQMISAFGQFVAEIMDELKREVIENPAQMIFVISNAYKPDTGASPEHTAQDEHVVRACGHLLFYANQIPGSERDNSFSEPKFRRYVGELLRLAAAEGYTRGAQNVLGELFAHAPKNENSGWPPTCVCEILDLPQHDRMRRSFEMGVYNNRGVTTRMPYDGGGQERVLAERYRHYSNDIALEFPLASKVLSDIAESYERDALRHDRDAEFSKDRY